MVHCSRTPRRRSYSVMLGKAANGDHTVTLQNGVCLDVLEQRQCSSINTTCLEVLSVTLPPDLIAVNSSCHTQHSGSANTHITANGTSNAVWSCLYHVSGTCSAPTAGDSSFLCCIASVSGACPATLVEVELWSNLGACPAPVVGDATLPHAVATPGSVCTNTSSCPPPELLPVSTASAYWRCPWQRLLVIPTASAYGQCRCSCQGLPLVSTASHNPPAPIPEPTLMPTIGGHLPCPFCWGDRYAFLYCFDLRCLPWSICRGSASV